MVPATTSLVGFSGEIKWPLGQITLLVKIGDDEHSTSTWMDFMVVKSTSLFNGIIGRPGLRKMKAVPSTTHRMIKFPIAEHKLNVRKGCQPVRQKKRGQAAERNIAINDEVSKLVTVGIMREVHYPFGISNAGSDGKEEMKNNAYKGYHQIQMVDEDEEKTAFITNQGIFCYTKMPFGLRNTGATYQWLVDKTFHGQIGRKLEVYVDDLVIKSRTEDEVNTKGIKICPDKVDAVLSLQSPKCLKDVQKLNGKLASLNRFLAKSAEKSLPFFKTLKKCTKKSDFLWTKEAEAALVKWKQETYSKVTNVNAPRKNKRKLIVYLAASKEAVSAVLMTEREARQMPIYFVSRALRGPEVNYTAMEKLVLALVHASKRLRRYFQAHPIIVITDQPIKNILSNPEVAGRMQKWSIQLGEFGIHLFRQEYLLKGKVLETIFSLKDQGKRVRTIPQRKKNCSWHGGLCSWTARLVLTDAEQEIADSGKNRRPKPQSKCRLKTGSKPCKWDLHRKRNRHGQILRKDALSKMASTSFAHLSKQVLVEELKEKSMNEREVFAVVKEEGDTWMTPIHEYLMDETLPVERKRLRAIKAVKSQRFSPIINGILYKKLSRAMLRWVDLPLEKQRLAKKNTEGRVL
ncbi:reverse transcriptase domain-containing protein [Tanacetum coccineum]